MSAAEITLKEVYDVVVEVRTDVTSIKEKLDATQSDVKDHEARIRKMEKWIWAAGGAGAIGGALLSPLMEKIVN